MSRTLKPSPPCKGHETPWFNGLFEPARVGLYQREAHMEGRVWLWSWWNGHQWMASAVTPDDAVEHALHGRVSTRQKLRWRGCAQPMTATAPEPG
jgi:Na+-transporting NADH:ubiquinone oxidoreductase subunit NqrB